LEAPAPSGGTTVHLESLDPSQILVSSTPTTAGAPAIDLSVAAGATQTAIFYIHSAAGAPLDVGTTLRATASGYQTGFSATLTVVTPYYRLAGLATSLAAGAQDAFQIQVGALLPESTLFETAPVRGGDTLALTLTSSDASVADLLTATDPDAPVTLLLPAGASSTPSTVAQGGVALEGLSSGTTTVAAIGGVLQPCIAPACAVGGGLITVTVP
jgi:hypothetical protein